jgi:hypothetical protein
MQDVPMRDRRFTDRSLNVRLGPKLAGALERVCEQQEVTPSEFTRDALRKALTTELQPMSGREQQEGER